tara:strand:- start:836 stop:1402 length:567 start_codon:yes stop_codon:yes gene_type:complete
MAKLTIQQTANLYYLLNKVMNLRQNDTTYPKSIILKTLKENKEKKALIEKVVNRNLADYSYKDFKKMVEYQISFLTKLKNLFNQCKSHSIGFDLLMDSKEDYRMIRDYMEYTDASKELRDLQWADGTHKLADKKSFPKVIRRAISSRKEQLKRTIKNLSYAKDFDKYGKYFCANQTFNYDPANKNYSV